MLNKCFMLGGTGKDDRWTDGWIENRKTAQKVFDPEQKVRLTGRESLSYSWALSTPSHLLISPRKRWAVQDDNSSVPSPATGQGLHIVLM